MKGSAVDASEKGRETDSELFCEIFHFPNRNACAMICDVEKTTQTS